MIYLKAYRVLKAPTGAIRNRKITTFYYSWINEFEFDFDIYNPKEWGDFLANRFKLPNGNKLPDYTADKEPIVYLVVAVGTTKIMREISGHSPQIHMFPGYHKESDGGERKNFIKYGSLKRWRK